MARVNGAKIPSSLLMLALVGLPLPYLLRFDHTHTIVAVAIGVLLCGLVLRSPRGGIAAILTYLVVLGDYRRYASFFEGYPANDPLLLVPAAVAFVVFCLALINGRLRGRSTLAVMVGALTLLMVAQIFNPEQGGFAVGIGGALFYLVPMLWFWVGRAYGTADFVAELGRRVVVPLAALAAALGCYQSLVGLLPFEAAWVRQIGFEALYVSRDVVRAIGFFNSSAEYTRYLLIGCVFICAAWLVERSRLIVLLPLLLIALFLASSRGPIVMLGGTVALLWAVRARAPAAWAPRAAIAVAIAAALLGAALLAVQEMDLSARTSVLVGHQVEGLLNPTDTTKSTALGHLVLASDALMKGLTSVVGVGLGATTLAATKYGGRTFNAEVDVANQFYSLGAIGGFLYLAIIVVVLATAVRVWRRRRSVAELSLLGVTLATLAAWLMGGEYAIAAFVWFGIGAIDRAAVEIAAEKRQRAVHAHSHSYAQGRQGRWPGAGEPRGRGGRVPPRVARHAGRL
jgi:hypothetical protein